MNNDAPAAIAIDLVSDTATRPCANGVFGADETLRAVAGAARGHGLLLHMDGARLMNAAVATGIAAQSYAELFDSVWLDLSKGLGCPVGGVLAGSSAFIQEADRWKHRFGGASTWPARRRQWRRCKRRWTSPRQAEPAGQRGFSPSSRCPFFLAFHQIYAKYPTHAPTKRRRKMTTVSMLALPAGASAPEVWA
jgi:hypothetical protein